MMQKTQTQHFYASTPTMAFAGRFMFSGCPYHSCECDISKFGRNVHSRMNWQKDDKKYLTHMSNKIKDILYPKGQTNNVLITVQHHRSEMSTWLVWGGCEKPQCAVMMCTVTSKAFKSASYTIDWGTITQYLCVCMRVHINAAQTMVVTQWCQQQNPEFEDWCATTWLQQSE